MMWKGIKHKMYPEQANVFARKTGHSKQYRNNFVSPCLMDANTSIYFTFTLTEFTFINDANEKKTVSIMKHLFAN